MMSNMYEQAQAAITQVQQAKGWQDKYRLIMLLGKVVPELPAELKQDQHLVEGCESAAWLVATEHQGRWSFQFDADARIIKGVVAMLLSSIEGKVSAEIQHLALIDLFNSLGLSQGLSPSRSNGVHAVIEKIRALTGP